MSKNVAVFVDVANIFYAAKAAGADIDYVTLLKAAVAGRDFVRAYAYTGLDPDNENQRNFHAFLARHGYKVVSKDIRKYGDGKVKANLDIELVVDMMKTARNLDVAIVVSGDGDFAPAIRAVQEMGVRVEVISFRGNTSSDLIEAADAFYDIITLASVDHDSRSGRRVAGDEDDLSMTEVPDKLTEGRGGRRGRGRGRGRAEPAEEAVAQTGGRTRARGPERTSEGSRATPARGSAHLVALPGEKLSHAASPVESEGPEPEETEAEGATAAPAEGEGVGGEATGRRRRRRGGRGRGHGRTPLDVGETDAEPEGVAVEDAAPAAPRPNQFGSVWDSQIGMAGRPERLAPLPADEDDFAEPEIPEYLLAERRTGGRGRGQSGGRGVGRGVRSAYASAVDRERYGRSGSRFPEPARQPAPQRRPSQDRQPRRAVIGPGRGGEPRPGRQSSEPWSEVPPELEELLRAQLSTKLTRSGEAHEAPPDAAMADRAADAPAGDAPTGRPAGRRGGRRKAEPAPEAAETLSGPPEDGAAGEKAKAPAHRRGRAAGTATAGGHDAKVEAPAEGAPKPAASKRRSPVRRKAASADAGADGAGSAGSGGEPAAG